MSAPKSDPPAARGTYRHGDLRRVLISAGIELARGGGPEAVALREATRRAGVVPNAAYRHFASRDELLSAVRSAALSALADAIERTLSASGPEADRITRARSHLHAVGLGYLDFATAEPGLFRTAFVVTDRPTGPAEGKSTVGGLNPFELLGAALDEMVGAGLLPTERRPGAEYLAWSAVHGLAMLLNEGPLSWLDPTIRARLGERLVGMVERGL